MQPFGTQTALSKVRTREAIHHHGNLGRMGSSCTVILGAS